MIRNVQTGRYYIGSAKNIEKRWGVHLCQLRHGKHHSRKLQRAWNKYGESSFIFSIVEEVSNIDMLIAVEQGYLDQVTNWRRIYNSNPVAGSSIGRKLSKTTRKKIAAKAFGRKATAEAKAKMSESHKGKKKSPEHIAKIAEKRRARAKQPISEETRMRMSASAKQRVATQKNRGNDGKFYSFGAERGVEWSEPDAQISERWAA